MSSWATVSCSWTIRLHLLKHVLFVIYEDCITSVCWNCFKLLSQTERWTQSANKYWWQLYALWSNCIWNHGRELHDKQLHNFHSSPRLLYFDDQEVRDSKTWHGNWKCDIHEDFGQKAARGREGSRILRWRADRKAAECTALAEVRTSGGILWTSWWSFPLHKSADISYRMQQLSAFELELSATHAVCSSMLLGLHLL